MDLINIYILTTNKGLQKKPTAGEYIIEVIHEGEIITYPPQNKSTLLKEINTGRIVVNKLLCNALYMLTKLTGLSYDHADVYIEPYTAAQPIMHHWINKWQQDGWRDSKGNPIDETYKLVKEWIDKSVPLAFHADRHSYSDVMNRDLEKYQTIENAINSISERSS